MIEFVELDEKTEKEILDYIKENEREIVMAIANAFDVDTSSYEYSHFTSDLTDIYVDSDLAGEHLCAVTASGLVENGYIDYEPNVVSDIPVTVNFFVDYDDKKGYYFSFKKRSDGEVDPFYLIMFQEDDEDDNVD